MSWRDGTCPRMLTTPSFTPSHGFPCYPARRDDIPAGRVPNPRQQAAYLVVAPSGNAGPGATVTKTRGISVETAWRSCGDFAGTVTQNRGRAV